MKLLDRMSRFFLRLLNPDRYQAQLLIESLNEPQKKAVAALEDASERYTLLVDGHISAYNVEVLETRVRMVFSTAFAAQDIAVPVDLILQLCPPDFREQIAGYFADCKEFAK
ncbi:MAG: hypothetical protein KBC02_00865 [Candidatus Pacebacteria bacterium]|nr:hypothetical protein [Candidatus Paceibacterota bacterium]